MEIIDCDVHHAFAWSALLPYMPAGMRHRIVDPRGRGLARNGFRKVGVAAPPTNIDPVAVSATLAGRGVTRAVLTGTIHSLGVQPNFDLAAAVARAINDWTRDTWLRQFSLFKGSILIAQQDADQAVAEIDRLGDDPAFVQVLMCSASEAPLGRRQFHPIYAACERHGLPLALHIGGEGSGISAPSTAVGHPNTYLEWYSSLPQAYMAHMTSMISEGVFERFPGLRIVMCEGGLGWIPHVVWRFEKNYKAVRAETPWVTRLPSQYAWDNFRHTTYPLEEFPRSSDLESILKMIHADRTVLFSTGYPDWEFGDPFEMVADVPEPYRHRILAGNARDLYRKRLDEPNV